MNEPNKQALQDIPYDQITEAAGNFPRVVIHLMRKTLNGKLNSLKGGHQILRDTMDLHDIAKICEDMGGGGEYCVRCTSPTDRKLLVVPTFYCRVEGEPRAAQSGRELAGSTGTLGGSPMWQPMMMGPATDGAPVASMASDAVAMDQLSYTRQELMEARQLREQERQEADARTKKLEDQLTALSKQLELDRINGERQRHEAEMRAMQEKTDLQIKALSDRLSAAPAKPATDWMGIAAFVAPIVTAIGPAWVSSSRDRENTLTQMQQKSMETFVTAINRKDAGTNWPEVIKNFAPLLVALAPFLKQMADERSPSKTAALVNAMGEANMTQLGIVMQLVQSMTAGQGEPPVWLPVVQQAIGSLMEITQHVVSTKRSAPATSGQIVQHQQQPIVQQQAPQGPTQAQILEQFRKMTPLQLADALFADPQLPGEFKTPAWKQLFLDLHAQKSPKPMAEDLAMHLQALDEAEKLPTVFEGMFDDTEDAPKPSELLVKLLGSLPISQLNSSYLGEVLAAFDDAFAPVEEEAVEAEPMDEAEVQASKSNGINREQGTVVGTMRTPGSAVHA